MIRMLIIDCRSGVCSERRPSRGAPQPRLSLFCRIEGRVPYYSTFSKNRYGRFRDSDLLRHQNAGRGYCRARAT